MQILQYCGAEATTRIVNINSDEFYDVFVVPVYSISPESIFANTVPGFDVNFLDPKLEYDGYRINDPDNPIIDESTAVGGEITDTVPEIAEEALNNNTSSNNENSDWPTGNPGDPIVTSPAVELQKTISSWYVSIRNMVLVAYMSILVYVGIRILISATAVDKAKYKEHLQSWLVGLLLVVFMHYIMLIALTLNDMILSSLYSEEASVSMELPVEVGEEEAENVGSDMTVQDDKTIYNVNFTEYTRIMAQAEQTQSGADVSSTDRLAYTVMFLAFAIYTIMFIFIYLKRVLYMAFLTVMAPIIALTYPIDKLRDGKAQGFDMWIKEYLFNLLLQPLHLSLYIVLIGSAMDLATSNMLYALVALGFILPAEKLMRKFFGFQNSETGGKILGGAAGGAMAMGMINASRSLMGKGGKGSIKGGGSDKTPKLNSGKVRTSNRSANSLYESLSDNSGGSGVPGVPTSSGTGKEPHSLFSKPVNAVKGSKGGQYVKAQMDKSKQRKITRATNRNNRIQAKKDRKDARRLEVGDSKMSYIAKSKEMQALKRNARAVGKTALRYTGKGLKKVPRMAAKGYGMAALGAVGVAAGLVSDDYSNVLKFGAAGAAVGALGGNAIADGVKGIAEGTPNIASEFRNAKYEYDEDALDAANNKAADRAFKKDKEAQALYKQKFGKDQWKQAMDDAIQYREYGVTDDEAIIKAMKLEDKYLTDTSSTSEERILMARAASTVKNQKDLDSFAKTLKDRGIESKSDNIVKAVRKMNKI